MIEIVPNWHPSWVHFAIALLLFAGSAAIAKAGLGGAKNVIEHGLGVQQLPRTEGEGHDHEGHDHVGGQEAESDLVAARSGDEHQAEGHEHAHPGTTPGSETAPGFEATAPSHPAARVASELNRALASGDGDAVRSLMAEDVLIFESGNVEASLEEYAGHHLPSDMAFMAAMDSEVVNRWVIDSGDMAIVLTRYRLQGRFKGRDIDTTTTETLVLREVEGDWKIVHVHWSSG